MLSTHNRSKQPFRQEVRKPQRKNRLAFHTCFTAHPILKPEAKNRPIHAPVVVVGETKGALGRVARDCADFDAMQADMKLNVGRIERHLRSFHDNSTGAKDT